MLLDGTVQPENTYSCILKVRSGLRKPKKTNSQSRSFNPIGLHWLGQPIFKKAVQNIA